MYYDRRYRRRYRGPLSGLAGGIFLIGLALAFFLQSQFGGGWFLPIFFIGLGFSILIGSIGSLNPRGVYGGLYGFFWMLILALFFITGSWIWFLVGAGISAILGALARPLMAGLLGAGIFAATQPGQQQYQQPPYQQPYPPYQQGQETSQPYQQGYQPTQPPPIPGTYEEGGQQHQYPQQGQPKQQHDAPETQYPQQMPPQQQ
jgi:hypothetical protein